MKRTIHLLMLSFPVVIPAISTAAGFDAILNDLGEYSPRGDEAQRKASLLRPDELRELLTFGLKRENPQTRIAVIRTVERRRARELIPLVIDAGRRDTDWRVKDEAMFFAKGYEGVSAADFIRSEAQDENPIVQSLAIRYLADLGFKEDTSLFQEKLSSDDPHIRLAAARALVGRGINVDHAVALQYVNSDKVSLRDDAIELLGETGLDKDILDTIVRNRASQGSSIVAARIAIYCILLRQLSGRAKAYFLKEKLSDVHDEFKDWAAFKLLALPDGTDVLQAVSAQIGHVGKESALHAIRISRTAEWRRLHPLAAQPDYLYENESAPLLRF